MRVNRRFTFPFRRKQEQKTNYYKRLKLLVYGQLRVVVRRTANHAVAQLVQFDPKGDKVLVQADSRELKNFKWAFRGNLPSAYLTGFLLASRAKKLHIKGDTILDLGAHVPQAGSRVYAALKGCVDGGLSVLHSKEILPSDDRVSGVHIAAYADQVKNKVQFSRASPKDLPAAFAQAKKTIEQMVK